MRLRQRRYERVDFEILDHRSRSAGMVRVVVRDDQRIQARDSTGAQVRRDHPLAAVGAAGELRTGIVEQRAIRSAYDPGFAMRGSCRRHRERRSEQREPASAPRNSARRKHPGNAGKREHDRPGRGHMLLPHRRRQRRAPLEELHQQLEQPGGEVREKIERQHRGDERKRRHGHRHERDRDRVRERPDDRDLREEKQRSGRKAEGDRPLGVEDLFQPAQLFGFGSASRDHIEDERHRAERKPRPGAEHGPRIEQDDHAERERKRANRGRDPARPQRKRHHAHHPERALRRNRETGDQRVAQRADDRRDRGGLACRKRKHQRRDPAPQCRDEPREESGNHRHVQSRYAHQVRNAGAVEEPPLLRRDRALVADGKRGEDPGRRRFAEQALEAVAHVLARLLYAVGRRRAQAQALRARPRPHITGRADAALDQPCFIVEAMRIEIAVRRTQPNGESPALGCVYSAVENRRQRIGARRERTAIPRQQDLRRQPGVGAFDVKFESNASIAKRGQSGDDTDDLEVAAFELRREPVCHPHVSECRRPKEPGCDRKRNGERALPRSERNAAGNQPQPCSVRQLRLQLK